MFCLIDYSFIFFTAEFAFFVYKNTDLCLECKFPVWDSLIMSIVFISVIVINKTEHIL